MRRWNNHGGENDIKKKEAHNHTPNQKKEMTMELGHMQPGQSREGVVWS